MLEEWINQIPVGQVILAATFLLGVWVLFKKIHKELTETTTGWFKRATMDALNNDEVRKKISEVVPQSDDVRHMSSQLEQLAGRFQEMMASVEELRNDVGALAMETRKNFLVQCLSDLEQGEELEQVELERFHESYTAYIRAGGNSYIKGRVEKLKEEGKL